MFECPSCHQAQVRAAAGRRALWICPRCRGRLATIALLRRLLDREIVERYWWQARRRKPIGRTKRPCPACGVLMREIPGPPGSSLPPLDICKHCQLFWFDPREYQALPPAPPPKTSEAEAREAEEAELRRREAEHVVVIEPVDRFPWELPVLGLGLPLEIEAPRRRHVPWLTLTLAALISIVSLLAFLDLDAVVRELAFLPARPMRHDGLTLLTSFLLHGDFLHLFGNVYFLLTFGDNVEDYLGRWRYGLLLFQGHVLGLLLHLLFDPRPWVPTLGASAAVSGVVTFYALRFPRAKIVVLWTVIPLKLGVLLAFGLWILLQSYLLGLQMAQLGSISALAHAGGVLAGLVAWAEEELPYRWSRWRRGR